MCNRPLRVGAWQWGSCVGERELSPPTQEMVVGREESCQDWPSNPAGLRSPHPGEAGISRRVWNPLQKVARDAGKGGWRKDRVNLPTRDQEEKVGAGGFEEPLYSFPPTRTSWIQPRPPGGGAGKGGVSNWLKAEGTSDHPTLCNDGALTTHHHRPTMGWIPPRWSKPIILLRSRSELGSSPGLTRQKHINHSPHLPPPAHLSRPQYQIRSVPSFEETAPLSWLGAGEGRGSPAAPGGCTGVSRRQLPADAREFFAGSSQPICTRVCPRTGRRAPPTAGSGREDADLFWLALGSTPSRQREARAATLCGGSAHPPHTHAAYSPSLSSLPWDSESFRLKTFISRWKARDEAQTLLAIFYVYG